jgi:glycosyltransferase involved in cell wall biosynthesis
MVGVFPPPVHGMSAISEAVRDELSRSDVDLTVLRIGSSGLMRSPVDRLRRMPRIVIALIRLAAVKHAAGAALYMSVSGGMGQIYEILFLIIARIKRMRCFLHHHSFAYLDRPSRITRTLTAVAGREATHLLLSEGMASRFREGYPGTGRVLPVSNCVFLPRPAAGAVRIRGACKRLGFLSNISEEKGIWRFLDLVGECEGHGLGLMACVAGPFIDSVTEGEFWRRTSGLVSLEYHGPVYGAAKEAFYSSVDVFIFPSLYVNEAEPLVVHEALMSGVPVIAYRRGAIDELLAQDAGFVIAQDRNFALEAFGCVKKWVDSPERFRAARESAVARSEALLAASESNWRTVLREIAGRTSE